MMRETKVFAAVIALSVVIAGCGDSGSDSMANEGATSSSVAPTDGYELLRAMHDRYADDWYETLVFDQEVIQYRATGTDTSTWYEAMKIPGQLRIDMNAPSSGNAYIFANDSIYVFVDDEVTVARPTLHPLLLLGFDVYRTPPEELAVKIDSLGFDLTVLTEGVWQGEEVYIAGAGPGETGKAQFWIEKERLLFVRMLQPAGPDGTGTSEVRFNDYEVIGDGWIAPEVIFYFNDTMTMTERYANMSVGDDLDDALFVPATALSTEHWLREDSQ
jgi:hypothetical protein